MDSLIQIFADPHTWAALATLIVMEVVLGIDNLIFVSILTNRLPAEQQVTARRIGIGLALVLRLVLLGTIAWIVQLTQPLFEFGGHAFSWRDLILIAGGLFLVWKATREIHHNVDEGPEPDMLQEGVKVGFSVAITQIIALDLVFSLDSILTAIGMTDDIPVMVIAVIVAVLVMLAAVNPLSNFLQHNPTIVMLALGFLLMIGMVLIADGFGVHVPKGYIYAAMAFSAAVEALNMLSRRARKKREEARRAMDAVS